MEFKEGQKIVCVDASNGYSVNKPTGLVKNKTYTFSYYTGERCVRGYPEIMIKEIRDQMFSSRRFRPIDEIEGMGIEELIEQMNFYEYEPVERSVQNLFQEVRNNVINNLFLHP